MCTHRGKSNSREKEDFHSQRQEVIGDGGKDSPASTHIWDPGHGGTTEWAERFGPDCYRSVPYDPEWGYREKVGY